MDLTRDLSTRKSSGGSIDELKVRRASAQQVDGEWPHALT
jgi:hypothetical protein